MYEWFISSRLIQLYSVLFVRHFELNEALQRKKAFHPVLMTFIFIYRLNIVTYLTFYTPFNPLSEVFTNNAHIWIWGHLEDTFPASHDGTCPPPWRGSGLESLQNKPLTPSNFINKLLHLHALVSFPPDAVLPVLCVLPSIVFGCRSVSSLRLPPLYHRILNRAVTVSDFHLRVMMIQTLQNIPTMLM